MNINLEMQPQRRRENFLSKKLKGRIKNAFDNCQLVLVGGDNSGRKAKSSQFDPSLHDESFDRTGIDATFVDALNVLLLNSGYGSDYIRELGAVDSVNLPAIAKDLAVGSESKTAVRIVFGATEEMPLRALSYVLPAVELAEAARTAGISAPQIQVIFANNISGRLNRQDSLRVRYQSEKFSLLAKAYVEDFFPSITESIVFLEDTPLDKESVLRRELVDVNRILCANLSTETEDELLTKGREQSSRVNYFYGAAHLLMHDVAIPAVLTTVLGPADIVRPDFIINIGGQSEKLFYRIRHEIKPLLPATYQQARTLQYFTRHFAPAYYMARGGDLSMENALRGNLDRRNIAKAAEYDLDYLISLSESRGDFNDFLSRARREQL